MNTRAAGWLKLYRSMTDAGDRIWNDPSPFDVRSARIDLLALANFAPGPYTTHYGVDILQRGEFVGSLRFLADRWKWPKSRVERFLKRCIADGFLSGQRAGQHGTVYLIVKYESYQGGTDESETPDGTRLGRVWDKVEEGKKIKTTLTRKKATWLTPYIDAWLAQYGTTPVAGKLAKALKPLHDELGSDECCARWRRYLLLTSVRHVSAARFVETHTGYRHVPQNAAEGAVAIPGAVSEDDARKLRLAGF